MSKCESCSQKSSCSSKEKCNYMEHKGNIKNIIGVISGKGGVGKSTCTTLLATLLRKSGYKVGVLDADITGPSIPRLFGINEKRAIIKQVGEDKAEFEPVETKTGIKVMSLNLLIPKEDDPVIWRGPMITGVLNQMYGDTNWGELDYLLIDMPPGTGDIALTVMQSINLSGMVVVSTPQDMVSMIVKKVITMAQKMNIDVMGVIENMSYIKCGSCGEKTRIFSKKPAEEHAKYLGVKLLAELPVDLDLIERMENGDIENYIVYNVEYDKIVNEII
ncbi:Mrp/NBP35 family ATP-binding protein [Oceanirhabdus sp. W0125-5]|uniref:Mrp/NBP35 family ATP-binding protein n=1 Tax=Oceanirhabdus sp. W0125-5 TaxID=2999116 RepID=UPI0022F34591|nr:Mrp/NBP35 family ATP-binding protein [Oceanirhabdus sp. W0125-5]WBW98297.1 Mrp/NBP35 family ATP-binding protein [Oceanirhabdus sp. W0125-5]